jgi:hypothetical protein
LKNIKYTECYIVEPFWFIFTRHYFKHLAKFPACQGGDG